jgi:hypothetical protein
MLGIEDPLGAILLMLLGEHLERERSIIWKKVQERGRTHDSNINLRAVDKYGRR